MLSGDPDAAAPYAWLVSRVCEEFHCLPKDAETAIEEDEEGLIFEVMDLRALAATKREFDHAVEQGKTIDQPSPMMRELMQLEYALMQERRR